MLHRIAEHLHKQNWTAVAIDFVIVVLGVFIGLQVSNWNEALAERHLAGHILERLGKDFEDAVANADDALQKHQRNLDGLQLVIESIDRGTLPDDEVEKFREGLRYAYIHINAIGRSATYTEILSSGQLGLIEDDELRKALISFDNTVQEAAQVFTQIRMHQSAHIRDFTRRFDYQIPASPITEENSWQPVGAFDFEGMVADPDFMNAAFELREAQRYYYVWHLRARNRAEEVRKLLVAEIERETMNQ